MLTGHRDRRGLTHCRHRALARGRSAAGTQHMFKLSNHAVLSMFRDIRPSAYRHRMKNPPTNAPNRKLIVFNGAKRLQAPIMGMVGIVLTMCENCVLSNSE